VEEVRQLDRVVEILEQATWEAAAAEIKLESALSNVSNATQILLRLNTITRDQSIVRALMRRYSTYALRMELP
jgi:hypothetical protein